VEGSSEDTKDDKNYFFWMHEAQNSPETAPFVIWLTGGPGCSSTLALLTENGPCAVNEDGTGTTANPNSWNTNANVLWLDQPAGVGFSYGQTNDANEDMVRQSGERRTAGRRAGAKRKLELNLTYFHLASLAFLLLVDSLIAGR